MLDLDVQDTSEAIEQARKDREYLAACEQYGIEPLPARYDQASRDHSGTIEREPAPGLDRNLQPDFIFYDDEPERTAISGEKREAFLSVLNSILPDSSNLETFVRTAGLRVLSLSWMMGRTIHAARSLADLADELHISRAILSFHVRKIEDATGLHGRAQKSTSAPTVYRELRIKQTMGKPRKGAKAFALARQAAIERLRQSGQLAGGPA